MRLPPLRLLPLLLLLGGCAVQPRQGPLDFPTPREAAQQPGRFAGKTLEWGGVIAGGGNRAEGSWLEVLAYPLNDAGKPLLDREPRGRFRAFRHAYIETVDFAPGRKVTVRGPLRGDEPGQVGGSDYRFPLLEAESLRLWREEEGFSSAPNIQFGIGVGVGGRW